MSLAAGDLTRFLRISKRQAGTDTLNRPLTAWEPVTSLWAQPRGRTGLGVIRAQEGGVPADVGQYSFRIRYRRHGLDVAMRVEEIELVGGVQQVVAIYEITNITHDLDRREWTDLVCRAGASDG